MYDGRSVDLNWDTKWYSKVKFDEKKWVCEIAIPFKSIRYDNNSSEWGINFSRLDLKASEKSSWAPVPRQFPSVSLAYAGALIWMDPPPKQENNISLIPYIANNALHTLLRGCRTLALPLFLGSCMFKQVAIGVGFPIAAPDSLNHDVDGNILNTKVASQILSKDNPFCLWISY